MIGTLSNAATIARAVFARRTRRRATRSIATNARAMAPRASAASSARQTRARATRASEETLSRGGGSDASPSASRSLDASEDDSSGSDDANGSSLDGETSSSDGRSNASDSNAIEEDARRRDGDPVLNDAMGYHVARRVEVACVLRELETRVSDPAFKPTEADEAMLAAMSAEVRRKYLQPLPTLESEAREQQERLRKEAVRGSGASVKLRKEILDEMPTDGWNRERKKERVKMKKNDPSAQGAYETRKLIEEGAGLFVAPMDKTKVRREMKKMERKTAGKGWFDMKAVEYTPELRREMRMLKLRGAYDPKRFYKNADTTRLPTHFQIGTVIGGAADFYSARLAKKDQKQSLAEEILHDKDIERVRKNRFAKIQEKNAGNMGRKAKRRLGGRDRGKGSKKPKM